MPAMIKLASPVDGFQFSALHAQPKGARRGGVIVLQEIFGLDKYVHEDVARWSGLGFEALAPALFDRHEPGFVAEHDPDGVERGRAHATALGAVAPLSDIQACVEHLKPRGPVFLVGYCYGGMLGWVAANRTPGLAAVSSYYGGMMVQNAVLTPQCPVICHFGAKDPHIPAAEVKAALNAAQPQVQVFVYEHSGHGFNNDGRPDSDPGDAALARQRTLGLFSANGAQ